MRENKKTTIITIAILVFVVCCAIIIIYEYTSPNGYFARRHADINLIEPDAAKPYTDLSGNVISIDDYRDTTLIINAWASWSPYSKSDFEILSSLKTMYGDNIVILAMNRMETKETAQGYLRTIPTYDGINFLVDPSDHLFKAVDGYAMPETIIYDRNGNIVYHKRGSLNLDELNPYIDATLQE